MKNLSKTLGKLTIPLLVLLAICFWAAPAYAKYGGGTGEPSEPYQIADANDLLELGTTTDDYDKHFILIADVNMVGYTFTTAVIAADTDNSNSGFQGTAFTGVFDGSDHTISNFTYTSTGTSYTGLFGYVDGLIKDLGLIDPNVDAGTGGYVGSLVGWLRNGSITNCYVEGGSVLGYWSVGGLVGRNYGTITNCYSTGTVSARFSGVGGLVGYNYGRITNCYSIASVSGEDEVGGLVGWNGRCVPHECSLGTISNCYSTGSVSGDWAVGGLVGGNSWRSTITNCYSTGDVAGESMVGGLVGHNKGDITNSFWDIETSGQTISAGGTGKTTAEMKMKITFTDADWDFVGETANGTEDIWWICEGSDYPRLWWEQVIHAVNAVTDQFFVNEIPPTVTLDATLYCPQQSGTLDYLWTQISGPSVVLEGINSPTAHFSPTEFGVYVFDLSVNDGRGNHAETLTAVHIEQRYARGTGTAENPCQIRTAEQMNEIGLHPEDWHRHFILTADIDLGAYKGTSFNIIGIDYYNPFTGVFDGSGHTISNFSYTSTDTWHIGLFGYVSEPNAVIKDLGLINPNVNAGTGGGVGSLVGWLINGTITACYAEVASVSGAFPVGGLVGFNWDGTISNCYSSGSVSGNTQAGGLVGFNRATIYNCYSTSSVSGNTDVGGLVGYNWGRISDCYSIGSVSGTTDVSGLVGRNASYGQVMHSFWDTQTSGQTTSAGGTGKTTAEMQMENTFTNAVWDFVGETFNGIEDIWFIPQQDYPHLWWEGMQVLMKLTPRTLNCRSYGNWVKAHITLPEGFTVADVDPDRPAVLHSFGFESAPLYVSVNENELVEIEAAFEREAVCSLTGDWPEALTVAGFLTDGNIFLGTSTVRMIAPGLKDIEELALYWLNADCVQPDFCGGIDLNRDSMVNLLDYALLLNCQVEFISE